MNGHICAKLVTREHEWFPAIETSKPARGVTCDALVAAHKRVALGDGAEASAVAQPKGLKGVSPSRLSELMKSCRLQEVVVVRPENHSFAA